MVRPLQSCQISATPANTTGAHPGQGNAAWGAARRRKRWCKHGAMTKRL